MDAGGRHGRTYRMIGAVAALLVVAGIAGYRTLSPGEILDRARAAYPTSVPTPLAAVYGQLVSAPLVVDGRLRVTAGPRQVSADLPLDVKSSVSPFWSYRRWPAQLIGVVAVGTTVVSQWSDGALVALRATTGTVAWRATLAVPDGLAYPGRRTGAAVVYDPARLLTAGQTVVALGARQVRGYDAATGRVLWQRPADGCADGFTGQDVVVCTGPAAHAYDARTGAAMTWPAGARTPVGCALGHSGCAGVRGADGGWAIGNGGSLTPARALAAEGAWVTGGVVVVPRAGGGADGIDAATGERLWTTEAGRVIAVEPGAVHLIVDHPPRGAGEIVTLEPVTGAQLSRYPLIVAGSGPFVLGRVYASHRFLFLERINPGATADQPDSAYYYPTPNVVVAGS